MLIPAVLARMIQADEERRATYEGAWIGAFGDIATQAGESEIRRGGGATLFPAYDVIDVERKAGVLLMNEAIFANSVRPLDDESAQAD